MAGFDAVKELLIRIGLIGGAEARAEIDATAASVEKMGAAGAVAGAAAQTSADAQAAALKEVEAALSRGAGAAQIWSDAQGRGVESVNTAYAILRGSVGAAETAIKQAQQAGVIVPPAQIKSLDDLKTTLAAATAQLAPHVAAVGGAAKAHGDAKIQSDLWTEALGRTGRTISALSESTNPLVAAIGRFLGPLAAAAVGLVFFNKVAGELKERGVDISTVGDKWGAVMDSLSIALGGTSKAMGGMISDMEKTQAGFTGLSETQRAFASGFDLMNAAIRPTDEQLKLFASVADSIPPELAAMGGGLDNVGVKARVVLAGFIDFNTQLNVVRTTAPALAQALTEEYLAIQKMNQGSEEQNKALADWAVHLKTASKSSEDFVGTLKVMYPGVKDVGIQYEKLTQDTTRLADGMKLSQAAGLTQQQTMAVLGPLINSVGKGYDEFGLALKIHNPELVGTAQAADKMREAFDPLKVKLHELALAAGEELKAFTGLVDSIDKAAKETGDYSAALGASHAQIDARIIALEKLQNSTKGLSVQEDAELKSLLALHKVMTDLTPEQEKANKAQEAGLKSAHDLSKSYEDLTRAREKDKESIEKHRVDFIAGMEAELKKAIESGNAQVKALTDQHNAMEIDDHEYAQSVNDTFAAMAMAKRAAVEAEDKENEEAIRKEKEHQKAYEEAAGAMLKGYEEATGTVIKSLADLKEKQAEYDAQTAGVLERVRDGWGKTTDKIKDHAAAYEPLKIVWGSFESTVLTGSGNINVAIDGMTIKLDNLIRKLGEVDDVSSRVFGGVGGGVGGGAPEQFGPPTPAPEPSGSAPGTEFTT